MVVKHDGTREEFSRKKLLAGLLKACEKRPVPSRKLEAVADQAESMLHDREEREISTREIGSFVMERLRERDQVAYVRFASVYRRFEDIDAFMDVLKTLIRPKRGAPDDNRGPAARAPEAKRGPGTRAPKPKETAGKAEPSPAGKPS